MEFSDAQCKEICRILSFTIIGMEKISYANAVARRFQFRYSVTIIITSKVLNASSVLRDPIKVAHAADDGHWL